MKSVVLIAMSLGLVACRYEALPQLSGGDAQGGDDSGGDTDSSPLDGPSADAPADGVGHTCYVPDDLGTLTLGSAAAPASFNWFQTSGADTVFVIPAGLPGNLPSDVLYVTVVKGAGFPLNQNIPFATTFLPNGFQTSSFVFGDYDNGNSLQTLAASNGSIRFTAIGENINDLITGTITMTDYHEVNGTTGANVVPGCTTKVGGVTFNLRQAPQM